MSERSELPSAFLSLWRAIQFGYRTEPWLAVITLVLAVSAAASDALLALWLKFIVDGLTQSRTDLVIGGTIGLAGSTVGTWALLTIGSRWRRKFQMRLRVALETHVARLQASIPTIEHHERPEYLNRLAVLRDQTHHLEYMYGELFQTVGSVVRLLVLIALITTVHPLMIALVVFAVPTVAVTSWRSGVQQRAWEAAAPHKRLAEHLFLLGTTVAAAKEIRLAGIADRLIGQRQQEWATWNRRLTSAHWATARWEASAWALFGLAYVGAIAAAAWGSQPSPGDIVLIVAAGSRLSEYVGTAAAASGGLRMWLGATQRLGWLESYAKGHLDVARREAPASVRDAIRLENVSFQYPGTEAWTLQDVSAELPAGSVIALVGDNGAGKSTLIKLLSRFYEPTAGRITIDGTDLSEIAIESWRSRLAAAYQDFQNFEFPVGQSIGVGDLERIDNESAVRRAAERAGAAEVVDGLPMGMQTQLGPTWPEGVELSFGQWQRVALARGLMRDAPLLLVLDEPTAALDAESEHALFEHFAAQARTDHGKGGITVLVTHRFSNVRMADLILVVSDSTVVEYGSHDQLMDQQGIYAELYSLQASGYRTDIGERSA